MPKVNNPDLLIFFNKVVGSNIYILDPFTFIPSKIKNKEANSFLIFNLCDYLVTCI